MDHHMVDIKPTLGQLDNSVQLYKHNIPKCYVVVKKLELQDISRISINPFSVVFRCGKCKKILHYGPKCHCCKVMYHYDCAVVQRTCCGKKILPPLPSLIKFNCTKCQRPVQFGPQCLICQSMFHSQCLNGFDTCCNRSIYIRNIQAKCGKCDRFVNVGPRCPLCGVVYHPFCAANFFNCCGVKAISDEEVKYNCGKCRKTVKSGSPLCSYCGRASHPGCLNKSNKCCGRKLSLDVYIIPSFKFLTKGSFSKIARWNREKKKSDQRTHKNNCRKKINPLRLKTSTNSEPILPYDLDRVRIIEVKPDPDDYDELPLLKQIEGVSTTDIANVTVAVPPQEVPHQHQSQLLTSQEESAPLNGDNDVLESFFYFLFNVVSTFPSHVQAQIKFDLFKTVSEAEIRLHNGDQSSS